MPKSSNNKRNGTFITFYTFKCKSAKCEETGIYPTYRGETWSGYIRWLKMHQKKCDCVRPFHFSKDIAGDTEEEQESQISYVPVMRNGLQVGEQLVRGGHVGLRPMRDDPSRGTFMNADTGMIHNSTFGKRVKPIKKRD